MRLTEFSSGGGCGCKISPGMLEQLLQSRKSRVIVDKKLLVGVEANDDAAVYKINENQALVNSLDFFPPIVDDPYLYGRIAACNSVSDIFAMGATPIMAMAILGMPVDELDISTIKEIMRGGESVCDEIGIPLAGGHSIDIKIPIYGMSVTGLVDVNKIKRNNTPKIKDVLVLSKPIGVGVISTAIKRGDPRCSVDTEIYKQFVDVITKINRVGAKLSEFPEISAMTDITGFGLIGHLHEMVAGTGLSAIVNFNSVPILSFSEQLAVEGRHTGGALRNYSAYFKQVFLSKEIDDWQIKLLCDPQTNGGLLVSVSPTNVEKVLVEFKNEGFDASIIGSVERHADASICIC